MDQRLWKHKVVLNELPFSKKAMLKEPWILSGASVSAFYTGFRMGPFLLDAGHVIRGSWKTCLITHLHADHIGGFSRLSMNPGIDASCKVYAPVQAVPLLALYNAALISANSMRQRPSELSFVGVSPGQEFTCGRDYTINAFQMDHGCMSTVGYGISRKYRSLNPIISEIAHKYDLDEQHLAETVAHRRYKTKAQNSMHFKGWPSELSATDIAQLVDIKPSAETILPQFCYLCDTAISAIQRQWEKIRTYPIIIIECTFYAEHHLQEAINRHHIHFLQLWPYLMQEPEILWVLVHPSNRYSQRFLQRVPKPKNVLIWTHGVRQTPSSPKNRKPNTGFVFGPTKRKTTIGFGRTKRKYVFGEKPNHYNGD